MGIERTTAPPITRARPTATPYPSSSVKDNMSNQTDLVDTSLKPTSTLPATLKREKDP